MLKKISQTGTMNELDVTGSKECIRNLFLNKEYISINSMMELEPEKRKKLVKELMYNDMLQIAKEEK